MSKRRLWVAEIFSKIRGATLSQGRATYHITIWQKMPKKTAFEIKNDLR